MNNAENTEKGSQIKGLTLDQINLSLYPKKFPDKRALEQSLVPSYRELSIYFSRIIRAKKTDEVEIEKSAELEYFLQANRPKMLFFEPRDITSLLPTPEITFDREKTADYEALIFKFNRNEVNSPDNNISSNQQSFVLARNKTKSDEYREPYLIIIFSAEYDGEQVIFYPKARTISQGLVKADLNQAMIRLLGLKEHRVNQHLEFKIKNKEKKKAKLHDFHHFPGGFSLPTTKTKKWTRYLLEVSLERAK